MKNLPLILSALALIGVIAIGAKTMNAPKSTPTVVKQTIIKKDTATGEEKTVEVDVPTTRIAFVDFDSLQNDYKFYQTKKKEFESREKKITAELERESKALQTQYASFMKRMNEGKVKSQAEAQAMEKKLTTGQSNLEKKQANLTKKLLDDQEKFTISVQKKIKDAIEKYNSNNQYDYVLSKSSLINSILYSNKDLDITSEVAKILNK